MTVMTPITHARIANILQFWFGEIPREAWFGKDEAFERQLRERFLAWYGHVAVLPIAAARDATTRSRS
jgi:uncharacterized protein (DUF924 family)